MPSAFPSLLLAVVSAFPPLTPPSSEEAFPPLPKQEEVLPVVDTEPEEPKDHCINGDCGKDTEQRAYRIRLFRARR